MLERSLSGGRGRVLSVFIALGVGAGLTWYFRTDIFQWLFAPAAGQLSVTGKPIYTGPTEMFSLSVGLAMKGGIVAACPILAYNVYGLFRPLLNKQQKRTIILFLWLILFFYLAGTAFAYFVLLPAGLGFLLQFGTDIATPMIRITEYMDMALAMLFWLGVVFEIPIIMLLLAKLRVVSHTRFRKVRRYVPIAALILSAIITPTPDFVNQLLVAGPIWALYEVGVFLAWMARPRAAANP